MTDSQSILANARKEARRQRRRELLDAASTLFLTRGYRETSVAAIVGEAGVAQGTFYLYFKTKSDVLKYLRGDVLQDYLASFEEAVSGTGPADARLVQGLEAMTECVVRSRGLLRVFREATTSDELQRIWIQGRETVSVPIAAVIRQGVEDGSFRVDDPRMAAILGLATCDDLLFESVEYGQPAPLEVTLAYTSRYMLRALGCSEERVQALVPLPEAAPERADDNDDD